MTTEYKIHVVNEQSKSRKFWLFLSEPEKASGQEVFANSSAYMTLDKTGEGDSSNFIIPLQYKLKVSASNHAVGLHTKIGHCCNTKTLWSFDTVRQLGNYWASRAE